MQTEKIRCFSYWLRKWSRQGIIKSLKICPLPLTIISADINPYNAGFHVSDEYNYPKLEDENQLM